MKMSLVFSIILGLLLGACQFGGSIPPPPTPPRPGEPGTLRELAARRQLLIGAAVDADALASDPQYGDTLAREFSLLVPENAMKFSQIHPEAQVYDFSKADAIAGFAQAHGMLVRGHTLLWYREDPGWLAAGSACKEALMQILHDHIAAVVGHYRGRVFAWDVVNEALDDGGGLRDSVWLHGIGPEYIDLAFQWAHEADPDALLFYNDYDAEGAGPKSDAVHALAKGLRGRGVPIGGAACRCI